MPDTPSSDVLERLLHWAAIVPSPLACTCMREAADTIERLSAELERAREAALADAIKACRRVDRAAKGLGHRLGHAKADGPNIHSHKSAEISLGALRCIGEIAALTHAPRQNV